MSVILLVDRHPVAMEADALEEIKAADEMESRGTFATVERLSVCVPRDPWSRKSNPWRTAIAYTNDASKLRLNQLQSNGKREVGITFSAR
jgi:hypothetical protein